MMGSAITRINFGRLHHGRVVLCAAWTGVAGWAELSDGCGFVADFWWSVRGGGVVAEAGRSIG